MAALGSDKCKSKEKPQLVCGLMSGTSCDAVDAALLWTDGCDYVRLGPTAEIAIPKTLRQKIRTLQTWADTAYRSNVIAQRTAVYVSSLQYQQSNVDLIHRHPLAVAIETELTALHVQVVQLALSKLTSEDAKTPLTLVGYHGNTICHFPPSRQLKKIHQKIGSPFTWQLGDGQSLSNQLQVPVVFRFRDNDIKYGGGEGAPLAPAYHRSLCLSHFKTKNNRKKSNKKEKEMKNNAATVQEIAVLNIGGVSNVTICSSTMTSQDTRGLLAFDIGPGNALLDDFMMKRTGNPIDYFGNVAKTGQPDLEFIHAVMHKTNSPLFDFLQLPAPRSCDRDQFEQITNLKRKKESKQTWLDEMSIENGAATLTLLTAQCIQNALSRVPEWTRLWSQPLSSVPSILVVAGGGRLNNTLLKWISKEVGKEVEVVTADEVGWRGDSVEAEAFAYLAMRSVLGLALSWPGTTGTRVAVTGGVLVRPVVRVVEEKIPTKFDDMLPFVGIGVLLLGGIALYISRKGK